MKRMLLLMVACWSIQAKAQTSEYRTPDYHPTSPTAFQFLKYTEMPVSEYTGRPNIDIPFYTIKEDGIELPISLSYHGGGIRVSEEASWVGLGWDLQIGSIVQQINDVDDFPVASNYNGPVTRGLPDYFAAGGDGSPAQLPLRYLLPTLTAGLGYTNPYPVQNIMNRQGFAVATDNYVPVDGQFNNQYDLFNNFNYDSEPDIFTLNVFGDNVKFIRDFKHQGAIVVLNKTSYKIFKTDNGFKVINPSGITCYFEKISEIRTSTSVQDVENYGNAGGSSDQLTSRIFFLTKIVSVFGRTINIEYGETAPLISNASYTQKLQMLTDFNDAPKYYPQGGGNYAFANFAINAPAGSGGNFNYPAGSTSSNTEKFVYLKSIAFPNGRMDFQEGDRLDMNGNKKLEMIVLKNNGGRVVKQWDLSYNYFDASGTTNNNPAPGTKRLKLERVTENNAEHYDFTYNSTQLPAKGSYAVDYWGYYNGQLSNSSLVPNPAALNIANITYSNGNNKNAALSSCKAATLEMITYPTGGKVSFDYELNQFAKSQMPDLPEPSAMISGCGLRIKSITHNDNITNVINKTAYSYDGGVLATMLRIYRAFPITVFLPNSTASLPNFPLQNYTCREFSANGVFSSNPLSSHDGVGYSTVTKEDVDANNVTTGKVVTTYNNNPDVQLPTIYGRLMHCNIPTVKPVELYENGLEMSTKIYNNQGRLLQKTESNYQKIESPIYYGARIMSYGNLYYISPSTQNSGQWIIGNVPEHLIAYYPIYDAETHLIQTKTTYYDESSNELSKTDYISYDYGIPVYQSSVNSDGSEQFDYSDRAWAYYERSGSSILLAQNRLTEITGGAGRKISDPNNPILKTLSKYIKEYKTVGSNVVVDKVKLYSADPALAPQIISFDQYDNDGKPLQVTAKGVTNSLIWDYENSYTTAEVSHAAIGTFGYTSFEAENKGYFNYSGAPVISTVAPTGKKAYRLTTGDITKTLDPSQSYTLSFWSTKRITVMKDGAIVLGRKTGATLNGFTNYEVSLASPSNISLTTADASILIDEVRVYPENAQMVTYTYEPLVGIKSQCDANNNIVYYDYDAANRLSLVKDQNRNILKKICYNYAGQPENCITPAPPAFPNAAASQSFTRNNCGAGYAGSTVTYTVPAGTYSAGTQAEADQMAQDNISANGQAYANINGTCAPMVACTLSNCSGNDRKCINGICEVGARINVSCVKSKVNGVFIYRCSYYYCFSDSTISATFTEDNTSCCPISATCFSQM